MNVVYCKDLPKVDNEIIDSCLYNEIVSLKNNIDFINKKNDIQTWNNFVRILNPYENVPYLDNIKKISRAFYKLLELSYKFNLFEDKFLSCGFLCESPGGFIECVQYLKKNKNIICLAQSLKESDCKFSNKVLNKCNIVYGPQGNGDITKRINIENFISHSKKMNYCNYITADGGFDVSNNYLKQEQLSFRLIFCEIVTALGSLQKNGCFVCKIFETYTKPMSELIYMLTLYFEKVHIFKPRMSRPCNSEKYIVCKKFRGINEKNLNFLLGIVEKLEETNIYTFGFNIPKIFNKKLKDLNNFLIEKQINSLKKVHKFYNNRHFISKKRKNAILKNNETISKNYLYEFKFF